MTAVVAELVRLVSVNQRAHFLPVFHQSTLRFSINGDVHHEEVKPVRGAGEDARFWTVALPLVELHGGEPEHSRVFWVAVLHPQLGREGCRSTWTVSRGRASD